MNLHLDLTSFLIGMVVATLVWWVISLMRPVLDRWWENRRNRQMEKDQKNRSGFEGEYLKAVFKQTQAMHLAASLFPLDEIVETPRLLAPPINFEPNTPHQHADIVEQTLPYLPDYPELGAYYDAPSLTPLQAISGGLNLAIIGQPGSGKTTALAYLASQLSRPNPQPTEVEEFIPFLIHVADLSAILSGGNRSKDYLSPIIEKISPIMKGLGGARFRKFAEFAFTNGRALLLLDGVDELPQAGVLEVSVYLQALLQQYPKARVIIAASPEYLDGLSALGFSSMALMPWNSQQQTHFLKNWGELWLTYISKEAWAQQLGSHVDDLLLRRWLAVDNFSLSPLEFTLKIWGAYAGDIRSGTPIDIINAHISRLTPPGVPVEILSGLALQAVNNQMSFFDGRQATDWIKSIGPVDTSGAAATKTNPFTVELDSLKTDPNSPPETGTAAFKDAHKGAQVQQLSNISIISELTISGLLTSHAGNKLRFAHPVFLGLLAGKALAGGTAQSTALMEQKAWSGQTISLHYLAAFGDVTEIVNKLLASEDPILMRPQLAAGRLLRDSNQSSTNNWRGVVIAELVKILHDDDHPRGLRGQAMVALALSGDTKVSTLFRQLLLSESNELRQLAALGSGLTRDSKAIDVLRNLTTNSLEATRRAACLALVEIGTPQALEVVAVFLLHGDEQLRIYAAEALANNPSDGREALREGIASDDILVRRAIIYGLSRIREPWATELLEKSQVNDEQWAVRNLAVEFLTARQERNSRIPKLLPVPHENTWLIEFAGKYGMGISPSQPATNVFLLALKDSNPEFFKPSLNYLKYSPTTDVMAGLYPFIYGVDPETKEDVFQTLAFIGRTGAALPSPRQFGLG